MAFPSVGSQNPTADNITGGAATGGDAGAASHSVVLPSTVNAGDLLMVFGRVAGTGTVAVTGGGWTITQDSSDASDDVTFWMYRNTLADGSEGGTSITVTHGTVKMAAISMAIPGAADPATRAPEGALAVGTSLTIDPPNLTPTGGAKDYLWIWFGSVDGEPTLNKTAATNYTSNDVDVTSGTAGAVGTNVNLKTGTRQNNASSENPGTVTVSATNTGWTGITIAVHPSPNATVTPARISPPAAQVFSPNLSKYKPLNIGLVVTGTAGTPSPNAQDTSIRDELLGRPEGNTLTYLSSADTLPNVGYDVLLVTESGSSSSAAITSIPTCQLPVMLQETSVNTMRFCSSASTNALSGTQLDITTTGNSHSITTGLADPLTVRSGSGSLFGFPTSEAPAGVEMLAVNNGATTSCVLAVADTGATLTSGTAPARRAYFGMGVGTSTFSTWTQATKDLQRATLDYLGNGGTPATVTPARISVAATIFASTPTTPDATVTPSRISPPAAVVRLPSFPGILPGNIDGIEPESHAYTIPLMDSNGNLYRISESFLAQNNQPKANKSSDGGSTWVEQDAANRPGTDTSSIGDLESWWNVWDSASKTIRAVWQRSFVAYCAFRTSDHATNPDTWVANTRENVAAVTGSPQYASITKPTDQSYEWIFYNNSTTKPSYKSRSGIGSYGSELDVDSVGQHPAAILAPNGTDTYIMYRKTNDLVFKKLTSGGTLDSSATRIDTNGIISTTPIAFAAPQMWSDGTNTYLGALFCNSSGAPRFVLVTNGTAGSEESVDADGVLQNPGDTTNDASVMSLAVDPSNGTFHAVYVDVSTGALKYRSRPHGGSWSSETELYAAPSTEEVDWTYCTVLNRSGTKYLGYTYDIGPHLDDAGAIKYNEVQLAGDATVQPARINGTTTVFLPTVQISHTVSPARIAVAATVFAASLTAPVTVQPARISPPTVTIQASTLTAPTTVTPARISPPTATIFSPTLQQHVTVQPARIDGTTTIFSPTVSAAGNATPQPARVNGATTVFAPTIQTSVTVSPARIDSVAQITNPTIGAGAGPTPARISTTTNVFAPSVSAQGNATVTPARIAAITTVFAPNTQASSTVTPVRISPPVVTVFAPVVRTGAGPTPVRIFAPVVIFAPIIDTGEFEDLFSPNPDADELENPAGADALENKFGAADLQNPAGANALTENPAGASLLVENPAGAAALAENTAGATLHENPAGATWEVT